MQQMCMYNMAKILFLLQTKEDAIVWLLGGVNCCIIGASLLQGAKQGVLDYVAIQLMGSSVFPRQSRGVGFVSWVWNMG